MGIMSGRRSRAARDEKLSEAQEKRAAKSGKKKAKKAAPMPVKEEPKAEAPKKAE